MSLSTPELDVARERLSRLMDAVDDANGEMAHLLPRLSPAEAAQLRAELRAALAIRLVAMSVADPQAVQRIVPSILGLLDDIARAPIKTRRKPRKH